MYVHTFIYDILGVEEGQEENKGVCHMKLDLIPPFPPGVLVIHTFGLFCEFETFFFSFTTTYWDLSKYFTYCPSLLCPFN